MHVDVINTYIAAKEIKKVSKLDLLIPKAHICRDQLQG